MDAFEIEWSKFLRRRDVDNEKLLMSQSMPNRLPCINYGESDKSIVVSYNFATSLLPIFHCRLFERHLATETISFCENLPDISSFCFKFFSKVWEKQDFQVKIKIIRNSIFRILIL
jgi:hypothetical protein